MHHSQAVSVCRVRVMIFAISKPNKLEFKMFSQNVALMKCFTLSVYLRAYHDMISHDFDWTWIIDKTNYTLSHLKNDCDVTEYAQGYTLQDVSFMHQFWFSFWTCEKTQKLRARDNQSDVAVVLEVRQSREACNGLYLKVHSLSTTYPFVTLTEFRPMVSCIIHESVCVCRACLWWSSLSS